ncbi:MAG: hypothetical protein R6V04_13640 [bacterium]
MKKTICFGIVLTLVMTAISGLIAIPTIADSDEDFPILYADQDTPVGNVEVTNDAENLYVKYFITEDDWCITETHLHVTDTLSEIPTNPRGNPIPGHFMENDEHDCVTEFTYTYNLAEYGWNANTPLYIAAHAVVVRPIEDCVEEVWMIGYEETKTCQCTSDPDYSCYTHYANEFNTKKDLDGDGIYTDPIEDCGDPGVGLIEHRPDYTTPFIVGTTPFEEFAYNQNTNQDYATNIDVQWNGELLFGGELTVSWSPGKSATEKKEVSVDGTLVDTFIQSGTPISGQGYWLDKYPVYQDSVQVDPLSEGTHTINFNHIQGDGTSFDWIRLTKPCEQWESAWGDGTRFVNRGNWATYFTYDIKSWECVEIINVNAADSDGENSDILEDGTNYKFEVTGTYSNKPSDPHLVDAKYISFDNWVTWLDAYPNRDNTLLELTVNDNFVNWGDYNPDHTYYHEFEGDGNPVNFAVYDTYYGDNVGSFTIKIYEWV